MGYWVEALKLGAEGKAYDARLLLEEIPDALRQICVDADGSTRYTGRVPSSVRAFVNALPEDWRALGTLYEDVFIDYIVEDVVLTAAATLVLVEVCRERPEASIEELVELYPWKEGLNRNLEWKRERITDNLRSMLAAGVALPAGTIAALRDEGDPQFPFDEVRYALGSKRMWQSWDGVKKQLGINTEIDKDPVTGKRQFGRLASIDDPDTNTGTAAEKADYGDIYIGSAMEYPPGTIYELNQLGKELSPEVTGIMEGMHALKPKNGYRPIAWHYVFWILCEEYENLRLDIKRIEPLCRTEYELTDHIVENYLDVVGKSRSTIKRRRDGLYLSCEERIHTRIIARLKVEEPVGSTSSRSES